MSLATDLERYMVELVNHERVSRGLTALVIEQNLNTSADAHSQWMTDADTFSHTGVNDSTPGMRMRQAGMDLDGAWGTAENIAAASVSGADSYYDEIDLLHQGLMDSPGHRANILNAKYDYIGLGLAFGPLSYSGSAPYQSVLVTQNFSYTGGRADLDVLGDTASNMLVTGTGDDWIDGGQGNDALRGGGGNDNLWGGNGFDTIHGGNNDDKISGGALGDMLYGENGNDTVDGGFGRDSVWLGNGDDVYNDNGQGGWRGGDRVFGGAGNDQINGGGGDDRFFGGGGNDVILGGNGNDLIFGGSGHDRIFAGNNDDAVDGGFGRDTVYLGNGSDSFTDNGQVGWFGSDRVFGGSGADKITLAGGNDTAFGGAGDDVFVFKGAAIEQDVIGDFETGVDALHLDDALWGGGLTKTQVVERFADNVSEGRGISLLFDFGDGNSITLSGVSLTDAFVDDLILF